MTLFRLGQRALFLAWMILGALALVSPSAASAADLLVGSTRGSDPARVLRYDGSTGAFVGVFAEPPPNCCYELRDMAFGPDGNLFVAREGGDPVVRFNGQTGEFIDFCGYASSGVGLAFDQGGRLYVPDHDAGSVRRFNGQTCGFIDTFITGAANAHSLTFGSDGNLYVLIDNGQRVARYNGQTGEFMDLFVSGGPSGAYGILFGPDGNLYISSGGTHEVLRFDGKTGAFIDAFVPAGSGGLTIPRGTAFGPDGHLYVASNGTGQVLRYNGQTGAFMGVFVSAGSGGLNAPFALTFRTPVVAGCVQLLGFPVVDATVQLKQRLESTRTTTTNAQGCYTFGGIVSGKRFKVIIKGPEVP